MLRIKPIDAEKILRQSKRLSTFITTKSRHFFEKAKDTAKDIAPKVNLSKEATRDSWKKTIGGVLDVRTEVTQGTQYVKKLMEGSAAGQKLLKLSQNRWFRRSAIGVAAIIGATMLEKTITGFNPKPVIPKNYERGYDIMNETMTDFGSPVKLAKTAAKIITPYYSSVRKGVITTTKAVTNKNLSLALSSKAIGHTRY